MTDLPLVRVVGLLLHDLEYFLAGVRAILGVTVYGDGLLEGADVVLSVYVDAGPGHLSYLADGGTLTTDNRTNHIRLDEDAEGEVRLPS